jgi:tetratricopeptide (TPR) repeat protein
VHKSETTLFGELLSKFLRKANLSKSKLAEEAAEELYEEAAEELSEEHFSISAPIISEMCKGKRLTGPGARPRVVAIIKVLYAHGGLTSLEEANSLLASVGKADLQVNNLKEANLLSQFPKTPVPTNNVSSPRIPSQVETYLRARGYERLIGRESEIKRVLAALQAPEGRWIVGLDGMGGIGKTAIAEEVAHHCASDPRLGKPLFEKVIWIQAARSEDPADTLSGMRLTFEEIVTRIGEDLNLPEINKQDVREQLARVRTALRQRRILIVGDNLDTAKSQDKIVEQLRPLLGPSKALLTSRDRFTGDVFAIHLKGLALSKAVTLIRQLATSRNMRHVEHTLRREELEQIARVTGGSPLAIKLVLGNLTLSPVETVLDHLRQAKPAHGVGNTQSDYVRFYQYIVFPSWRLLSHGAQLLLTALSRFPPMSGCTFPAIQAASGLDLEAVERSIDELWRLSFLEVKEGKQIRFYLHPLTHYFVRSELRKMLWEVGGIGAQSPSRAESDQFGRTADYNIVEYYLGFLEAIGRDYEALDDEDEFACISAALQIAHERRMHAALVRGVNLLYPYLEARGRYADAQRLLQQAQHSAQITGDKPDLMRTWFHLGRVARKRRQFRTARELLAKGLRVARRLKDAEQASAFLWNLAGAELDLGYLNQAEAHAVEASQLAQQYKNVGGALGILSVIELRRGNYGAAIALLERSIQAAQLAGDKEFASAMIGNLGEIRMNQGLWDKAEPLFRDALAIARAIENQDRIAEGLEYLGTLAAYRGHYTQAEEDFAQALSVAEQVVNRERISTIIAERTRIAFARGDYVSAEADLKKAMQLAQRLKLRHLTANILEKQAHLSLLQGRWKKAEQRYKEFLDLARDIQAKGYVADALFGLARVAEHRHKRGEALKLLRKSLDLYAVLDLARAKAAQDWRAELASRS